MMRETVELFDDFLQQNFHTREMVIVRLKQIWESSLIPVWVFQTFLEMLGAPSMTDSGTSCPEGENGTSITEARFCSEFEALCDKYRKHRLHSILRPDDFLYVHSHNIRAIVDEAVTDRLALERKLKKPEKPSEEIRTYQLEPFALDEFLQRVEEAEGHRLAGVYVAKTFLGMIREYSVVLCIVKGSPPIAPPLSKH